MRAEQTTSEAVVRFRVVCDCGESPFYEGNDVIAARRHLASLRRRVADSGARHHARLQRAYIQWRDVDD